MPENCVSHQYALLPFYNQQPSNISPPVQPIQKPNITMNPTVHPQNITVNPTMHPPNIMLNSHFHMPHVMHGGSFQPSIVPQTHPTIQPAKVEPSQF